MQFDDTPQGLAVAFKALFGGTITEEIKKEYRYVLYARKSTDDKEKQVRSLSDQVLECQEYAERLGLKIVEIINEAESAKHPDTRPKFRAMIQGLQSGKYDGILAWHPDRLARNMKDAGEIIDLVDKEIIKDLKFVSFAFENSPSGKMFLGLMFVISKEYSDKLSENVSRGNRRSLAEGKYINQAKHGYYKDPNQFLRPDEHNFILIKNMFTMRLQGKTLEEMADYLNQNGYNRLKKDGTRELYKMIKQRVLKIIKDPFYTGVLMYGKEIVNLTDLYDFQPAITVETYKKINNLDTDTKYIRLARSYHKDENVRANLMRGMVACGYCGKYMTTGATPKLKSSGEKIRYFYFRCDQRECKKKGESVRAKVILDYVYQYLKKKPFSNEAAYRSYREEMELVIRQRSTNGKSAILSLRAEKNKLQEKLEKVKEFLVNTDDEEIKQYYKGDLSKIEDQIKEIGSSTAKQKRQLEQKTAIIPTYDQFLELLEKIPENMASSRNLDDLDYMVKKVFLNFTVKNKKVEKSTLNKPFDRLFTSNVTKGGHGGT